MEDKYTLIIRVLVDIYRGRHGGKKQKGALKFLTELYLADN
jgi:hypothetical protein